MTTAAEIEQIFNDQLTAATELVNDSVDRIGEAFDAFSSADVFSYRPYEWRVPSAPIIGFNPSFVSPVRPGRAANPLTPTLREFPTAVTQPNFGAVPVSTISPPVLTEPAVPGEEPASTLGPAPAAYAPEYPEVPETLELPTSELPYPSISIPNAPTLQIPMLSATAPKEIQSITLSDYLNRLTQTYNAYANSIPAQARSNWQAWFSALLQDRPLINQLANLISSYLTTGGAGIPTPIEEAIVTRAADRVIADQRRAVALVYESAAKRGLTLPSGVIVAGLREARQLSSEAISKVSTDVAIKNLELEHDWMKFMIQMGIELEKMVTSMAVDLARVTVEAMNQAVELTKTVLSGMVAINDAIVKIYMAQWEGYKAAVEVYKTQFQVMEMQVRLYESQIKAELAKTEVNRATVEILNAVVKANQGIIDYFKALVDVETAKVEASRVQIMGYQAEVQAYAARIEAYRARWQGYTARVEGQVAKARVYESQVNGYVAQVQGYRAGIEAYRTEVDAYSATVNAVASENKSKMDSYLAKLEGVIRPYVADLDAYGKNWTAIAEQLRGQATATQIVADSIFKGYALEVQVDTERAREHLGSWRAQLEALLQAASGMTQSAAVSGNLAASALNGLTAFAGTLATTSE